MNPAKTQHRIEDGSYVNLPDFIGMLTAFSVLPGHLVQVESHHTHKYFDAS